ncbi:MAG: hypothetical protein IJZ47_04210 [Oscillospiraceae bacterium]|nr:hypothetical protein [Oscillospiraceae bacterium]
MKYRRTLSCILASAMIASLAAGCSGEETPSAVSSSETTASETTSATTTTSPKEQEPDIVFALRWCRLDKNFSYAGLRTAVNGTLGLENGTGVLFVNLEGKNDGNNTLYNALRNKEFVENILNDSSITDTLKAAASDEFVDVEGADSMNAFFYGYWDLLPVGGDERDEEFNADKSLTRGQAMTLVMRAITPVEKSGLPNTDSEFTKCVGETLYTDFASYMNDKAYMNTSDKSLNSSSFNSSMTKAEYVYMVMNTVYTADELATIDTSEAVLDNCIDGGDIAANQNFTGDNATNYEVELMMKNPDGGASTKLYDVMLKASAMGIISSDIEWSDPITKSEAVEMFVDAVKVYNNLSDFASTEEQGEIEETPIDMEALKAIALGYYEPIADNLSCTEDTYVKEFVDKLLIDEPEQRIADYLSDKYWIQYVYTPDNTEGEVATPVYTETTPSTTTTSKPVEDDEPTETKPTGGKLYNSLEEIPPYTRIGVTTYDPGAVKGYVEMPGGTFWQMGRSCWYSVDDFLAGKDPVDPQIVEGISDEEMQEILENLPDEIH